MILVGFLFIKWISYLIIVIVSLGNCDDSCVGNRKGKVREKSWFGKRGGDLFIVKYIEISKFKWRLDVF